jgi:hypothetical protein
MFEVRKIIIAAHVPAVWLLVVSVFLGPTALGASFALAADSKTCGASCACDDIAYDDHAVEAAEHDTGAPNKEDCPDDCPECSCCPGLIIGLLPFVLPFLPDTNSSFNLVAPSDACFTGDIQGVYRPPRSLT